MPSQPIRYGSGDEDSARWLYFGFATTTSSSVPVEVGQGAEHAPLDGLPCDRVASIVVARLPLDAAVSLLHLGQNIDRKRIAELSGSPVLAEPRELPPLDDWLFRRIGSDSTAHDEVDSSDSGFRYPTGVWNCNGKPNVMLVHCADLLHDLRGEMHRIGVGPCIDVSDSRLDDLVLAATFESMRS